MENDELREQGNRARHFIEELLRNADWDPESGVVTLEADGGRIECRSSDELVITLIERGESVATGQGPASPDSPISHLVRQDVRGELARYSAQLRAMRWSED